MWASRRTESFLGVKQSISSPCTSPPGSNQREAGRREPPEKLASILWHRESRHWDCVPFGGEHGGALGAKVAKWTQAVNSGRPEKAPQSTVHICVTLGSLSPHCFSSGMEARTAYAPLVCWEHSLVWRG